MYYVLSLQTDPCISKIVSQSSARKISPSEPFQTKAPIQFKEQPPPNWQVPNYSPSPNSNMAEYDRRNNGYRGGGGRKRRYRGMTLFFSFLFDLRD